MGSARRWAGLFVVSLVLAGTAAAGHLLAASASMTVNPPEVTAS